MASVQILAPGSVFAERFRIVELLAEGEMGVAYVVEVPPKRSRCVLKAMAAGLLKQQALGKIFVGYAKNTSKVESSNVLQTLDAGVDRRTGQPWFTTELLPGEDFASLIARKAGLPWQDIGVVLAALGEALGKAHARGLVHYDLTPENIRITKDRPLALKLRELTISRLVSDAWAAEGEIIGSAEWMPPEQFELGRRLTPPANVWSLALLAFYAATGCPYWKSASDVPSPSKDLLREILGGPIAPASQRARELGCPGLPTWFDDWFARCVVREQGKRPPNAAAAVALFAEGLRRHASAQAGEVDDQATTMPLPARTARAKGSRSLPRGIVAEARGGPGIAGASAPPASVAMTARPEARSAGARGGSGWLYLIAALCVAGALLAWLRLSSDRPSSAFETDMPSGKDAGTAQPLEPARAVSTALVEAGGPWTAGSSRAGTDARAAGATLAMRTFAADEDSDGGADYDLASAVKALNAVYYGTCLVPTAGKLAITFAPSGRVKKVAVLKGDYDEATTTCISARFAAAKIAPFRGGEQSVTADVVATRESPDR